MIAARLLPLGLALLLAACGSSPASSSATTDAGSDSGGSGGSAGGGGSANDAGSHARVFVTSRTFTGDLKDAAQVSNGLVAGDALCQQAAMNAGLPGSFRAWLSDTTTNAIDRVSDVAGGWYSVGSKAALVADSKAALIANGPGAPILDEHGDPVTGCPWTGTQPDGTKTTSGLNVGSDGTCNGWTAASVDFAVAGGIGSTQSPYNSMAGCPSGGGTTYSQCLNPQPIYCLQQ